jgi:hypothetical protein
MPKHVALLVPLVPLVALTASLALAHGAPRGEARVTIGGKAIVVEYGRPSMAGRDMLAKAPVGTTWRMGADAPTTLKTEAVLKFGATVVPKGDYALTATRTAEAQWTLNVEKRDPAKPSTPGTKVAEVPLRAVALTESVETLTLDLAVVTEGQRDPKDKDAVQFEIRWGKSALRAAFTPQ